MDPNNEKFVESIEAVSKLIIAPEAAAELYKRARCCAGGVVPQEDWAAWDALSGQFEAAWNGLMHAMALRRGLTARASSLARFADDKARIASAPDFASAMILLLAILRAVDRRSREMTDYLKSQQAESTAQAS